MKLFPDLFQFKSGRNPKQDAQVVPAGRAAKSQPRLGRLFLVAVRAPNDQLHVVAIPSCGWDEFQSLTQRPMSARLFFPMRR